MFDASCGSWWGGQLPDNPPSSRLMPVCSPLDPHGFYWCMLSRWTQGINTTWTTPAFTFSNLLRHPPLHSHMDYWHPAREHCLFVFNPEYRYWRKWGWISERICTESRETMGMFVSASNRFVSKNESFTFQVKYDLKQTNKYRNSNLNSVWMWRVFVQEPHQNFKNDTEMDGVWVLAQKVNLSEKEPDNCCPAWRVDVQLVFLPLLPPNFPKPISHSSISF